nr:hypothetical protein [Borreliella garinii]
MTFTIMISFTLEFNHAKSGQLEIHSKIPVYNFEHIATVLVGTYLFSLFQSINVLLNHYFKIKIKSLWIIHPLLRLISGLLASLTSHISKYGY